MKRFLLLLTLLFAALTLLTCAGLIYLGSTTPGRPISRATAAQPGSPQVQSPEAVENGSKLPQGSEVTASPRGEPPKALVEGYQQWVIDTIKQNPPVQEVEIGQDGDRFRLVMVVAKGTPVEEARRLGDSFVRLTKFYVEPGNGPGKFIGPGYYHYIVYVYLGHDWQLFEGRKLAEGDRIRWIITRPE